MRKSTLIMFIICMLIPMWLHADNTINLTPVPKTISVTGGEITLPNEFTISTIGLSSNEAAEAAKFANFMSTFGFIINVNESEGSFITMSSYSGSEEIGDEGYTLDITEQGIKIAANTEQGFYYAFQTIKKLLPPCVMAGMKDTKVTSFPLPLLSITDSPRFQYRGFMLDVARHYFEVSEIKRMIDVMSYYKMNRFHWHIVDDQGWRIQIDKYPKLTTIGATRSNSWNVDPIYGGYYTNEPYGPYFYTKEEARQIVEYAKERHIEVIPEIEFPGHACAALAAYPEFSCTPNGSHSVKIDGGVYADVFNVANPATLQFAKDVLDEITDIFPYHTIHIGGDECPTSAWNSNEECQQLMQQEGFGNIRELQSRFVRLLADHLAAKEDDKKRNVIMWNESLTANGTNVELIKGTNGTFMCWEIGKVQSAALQAAQLGMNNIITPIGPYYINRKQSTDADEPAVAGNGNDNLRTTYEYVPVPTSVPAELHKYYIGVQGTFWTEHVQRNDLLEYLALPRLIAIAETGWSPAGKKNFDDFCRRITADSVLLNYNNYQYGRHFMQTDSSDDDAMVMPETSTDGNMHWYRIVTGATDANRTEKCIELLREGSSTIGTGNAKANRLWSGTIVNEGNDAYDYQLWALKEDPENPGRYALVSKAKPNGSVNGVPTATNNTGRWDYDDNNLHYDFVLGESVYTKNGDYYRYSIRSQGVSGMYMNIAAAGQQFSINLWNNPVDGNSGVWEFRPITTAEEPAPIKYPEAGSYVRISNNVEKFAGWRIIDNGGTTAIANAVPFAADVWEVVQANMVSDGQEITLRNVATGRYISNTTAPIQLGDNAATLKNVYNTRTGDFSIIAGSGAIFPMPEKATTNPNTLNVGGIYPQGSAWIYEPVYQITYDCYDNAGNSVGKYYTSAAQGEAYTCSAPEIANMQVSGYGDNMTLVPPVIEALNAHTTIKVTYSRTAYNITIKCMEEHGGIITTTTSSCPIGESFRLRYPTLPYYTFVQGELRNNSILFPDKDLEVVATYSTEGLCGFSAVGNAVDKIEAGKSYLFFNNKNESTRNGFINANGIDSNITTDNSASSGSPAYVWHVEESGSYMKVGNSYGYYIPQLTRGSANKASENGGEFTFIDNGDGSFSVKGTNDLYWNGNDDHTFTGWTNGHPIVAYEYYVHPYFEVTIKCVDINSGDIEINSTSSYLPAGNSYSLTAPTIEGYTFFTVGTEGVNMGTNTVNGNIVVILQYTNDTLSSIDDITIDNKANNKVYDLFGRPMDTPAQKGIYIQGGKKILVR